jgi:hypothetical protein
MEGPPSNVKSFPTARLMPVPSKASAGKGSEGGLDLGHMTEMMYARADGLHARPTAQPQDVDFVRGS